MGKGDPPKAAPNAPFPLCLCASVVIEIRYRISEMPYWMISQMEIGNIDEILNLSPEQLDETGNTEMLNWATMLGMIGPVPGELIQYTPTWHHGHGYMRFLPQRLRKTPPRRIKEEYGGFKFKNKGYEFYKAPPASAAKLNRLLFDMRLSTSLCERIVDNPGAVAAEYELKREHRKLAQNLAEVGTTSKVSKFVPPFVAAGVHPLLALMGLHAIYPVARKALQSKHSEHRVGGPSGNSKERGRPV